MESTVKRLTRSTRERIFAGVCGGAANYLGIDPALARILFVAVTFITGIGPGIVVYLAAWFLVPEDDGTSHRVSPSVAASNRRVMAIILLAIGLFGIFGLGVIELAQRGSVSSIAFWGSVLVIALSIVLLLRKSDAPANNGTYEKEESTMTDSASGVKRLKRSVTDTKIAGICGGFGDYFSVDPTLVRVLWILATIISVGTGLLLYLILWVVMPLDADPDLVSRT